MLVMCCEKMKSQNYDLLCQNGSKLQDSICHKE